MWDPSHLMRNKKASRNAEPPPESGGVRARRARRRSFGGFVYGNVS